VSRLLPQRSKRALRTRNVARSSSRTLSTAELYDPTTGTFALTGALNTARGDHAALVAGGWSDSNSGLTSAEIYQPGSLTPANLVSISVSPLASSLSVGSAQRLVAIGTFSGSSMQMLASVVWNSSDSTVAIVSNASGSNSSIDGDSGNAGVVFGSSPGTATVSACAGSVCGSTTVSVVSGTSGLALSGLPTVRIIGAGQTASFLLFLTPQTGFQGTVALSCAGAPQGTSCVISPSSLVLNKLGRATATVTIASAVQSVTRAKGRAYGSSIPIVALLPAVLGFSVFTVRTRQRTSLSLVAIIFLSQLIACNAGPVAHHADIMPPGSYVITVTANAGVANGQTHLGLIVN
jgi:hypothetical protein